MITREFNLNLNAGRSTPLVIFANQFNSDEQWVFTLFDDSGQQYIPSSGSIVGIKADGLGIINSATVTAGKVVVDVTEQITACAGISEFELQLDNGTHGTANFKVVVEKKPSEGAEYSDSDISLIQEALDIVNPLPTGGTAGQVLTKTTNGSSWQDAQAGLPSGGTTGQVLTKTASGSAWQNAEKELPTGGSAGQVLTKTASGTTWSSVDAFPSEGTTGQVLTKATDGVAWTDAGNPTDTQVATAVSDWLDENITPTTPAVDATLTITGAAADAKKTGDEISELKSQISDIEEQIEGGTGSGLTSEIKSALMGIAEHILMWSDGNGPTYISDLRNALYPPVVYTNITLDRNSLSFGTLNSTQQLSATTTPTGGAVTWSSSNDSVATVSSTGLVTSVGYGNATITASCGGLTATCSVAVAQATVTSISAVYTQGTVDTATPLDSLKDDLVVTASWSNGTTSTVASEDYTLTGTLTEGTSVITVSYGGQSTTFNVTVTQHTVTGWYYPFENSLASEGTEDFGFTGVENYAEGVDGYAYYHKTDGASATDVLGIKATGLSDVPDLSGDWTIAFWHKGTDNLRGHAFCATNYVGSTNASKYKDADNVKAGWTISNVQMSKNVFGIVIDYEDQKLKVKFGNTAGTYGSSFALTPPSSFDSTLWHHFALTQSRDTGFIYFFIDGEIIFTLETTTVLKFGTNVSLGNLFTGTSAGQTTQVAGAYGDYIDDLYIAETCKWTAPFDPTAITY